MGKGVERLKAQARHGRAGRLPLAAFAPLALEAYYQSCALLGYRPRHALLDAVPGASRLSRPARAS